MKRINPRKTVIPVLLGASLVFAAYSFSEYRDVLAAESKVRSGVEAFKKGGAAQAEKYFRQAVAIEPSHSGGWVNLGITLQSGGKPVESLEAFRKALDLATDPKTLQMVRGRMAEIYMDSSIQPPVRRKDWYDRAADLLRQMSKAEPANAELHLMLGRALFDSIKPGSAFDEFKKASDLADTPDEKWIHIEIADFYRSIGMNDRAEAESAIAQKYSDINEGAARQ